MAGITGQGTTFNLPNFVGELFSITPEDTPFLSAIGGLTGGRQADGSLFSWQSYDLRDAVENNTVVEGADAPTAQARVRATLNNVLEIHQEAIEVSYSKQTFTGQYNSTGSAHPGSVGLSGSNPVTDEVAWQTEQMLKQIARDVERSFLSGTFANPATNATARKTQGIIGAITTNVVDAGNAPLTEDMVLDAMELAWQSGGLMETETRTVMCNSAQKRKLTQIFITDAGQGRVETSRNVGGVNLTTFETDFGRCNVMLNRHMPTDTVVIVSLEECAPRFGLVPGKGFLFVEDLAKVGAADRKQIYGEIGLEYGLEIHHAKISDLNTTGS